MRGPNQPLIFLIQNVLLIRAHCQIAVLNLVFSAVG